MKAINEYRKTKTFSIGGIDAEKIGIIAEHFGSKLVNVSRDPRLDEHKGGSLYSVRTANAEGITDYVVDVITKEVRIVETKVIVNFAETQRILDDLNAA